MNDSSFEHQRHKPHQELTRPRGLVVACMPMRSQINLARIARAAGCLGVSEIIACGHAKLDRKIARDAADTVRLEVHRSLPPVLKKRKDSGFRIVGLEQTTGSQSIFEYRFSYQTLLVVGNERQGITDDILKELDDVVELPVYGMPYSFNAATATCMAMYEYCRQFPSG